MFEQHLRRLAERHGVALVRDNGDPKRPEALNQDLRAAGAYDVATQKAVTAHLDLRNHAAHGEWSQYDPRDVALFIEWISLFMQKWPA